MPGDTTFGTYLCEVPLDQLVAEARAQERRHPNEGATDDAPGLELFRRAMAEGDEAAWHAIVELYRGPLLAQAGRHAVRPLVSESDAMAGICDQSTGGRSARNRIQFTKPIPRQTRGTRRGAQELESGPVMASY